MRVLVFGDSIAQGQWDSRGGWVQRLFLDLARPVIKQTGEGWALVFNLGVGSNTTRDVIKRLAHEIKARQWEGDQLTLVFAVGINDSLTFKGTPPVSSPEQYAKDLCELYELAQKYTNHIMFVGLTPVEEDRLPHELYTNERILQFEQVLREFIKEKSLPFVPVFETFKTNLQAGNKLLTDGLHPNDAGHELIYNAVKTKLASVNG